MPELYADRRGPGVDELIERIDKAAAQLSLRRRVPRLAGPQLQHLHRLDRARGAGAAGRPSRDGDRQGLPRQLIFGTRAERQRRAALARRRARRGRGPVDGLELNLLGLNVGISPSGLKLPLVGRIGAGPVPIKPMLPPAPAGD
jgi:hypothetical protein